jgi:hypothetical protein
LNAALQKYGKHVMEELIVTGFSKNKTVGTWRKKMPSKASNFADAETLP